MRKIIRLGRTRCALCLMTLSLWATCCTTLLAARKKDEPPSEPRYGLEYFVIFLLIFMGMWLVCRSAGRAKGLDERRRKKKAAEQDE